MAEEQITYEDLPPDHKKKYDELKAIVEAELIGSFEKTRSHGIRFKGFTPQGVLDGVDLSLPSTNVPSPATGGRDATPHQATSAVRNGGSTATRLTGIRRLQSWGDPGDYQFLHDPPKEIPHGYVCTYVPDCNNWMQAIQAPPGGIAGAGAIVPAGRTTAAAGSLGAEAEKRAWLAKYTTAPVQESSAASTSTADQISAVLRDQFGILPKKKIIGYSKPYPNEFDLIPLPPKYRLPDFNKFSGSEGSSSIEHVSRYLAQLGMASVSDQLRVRFFSQSLTGPAFGWYTSLPPNSVQSWKQLEAVPHPYHSEECGGSRAGRGRPCASFKDPTFRVEYNSLTHLVNRRPYMNSAIQNCTRQVQRAITLVNADEDEDSAEDQDVAIAEWTRTPYLCPANG
ncbi:hypothetical protein QYE76_019847 [Lolium multiflorum]|uniref:Uncharacterized protein n=1 Tax=Lolium multiflorum TaxID=4521 RepID=A0AAD8VRC7_LOLMU|nr:hypothetical protein QYE76_019847 [Lolium multiflorum]